MKRIRKVCPVILMIWPYLIVLFGMLLDSTTALYGGLLKAYFILTVVVYLLNIWNACTYPRKEDAGKGLAFYDMLIKLVHIPFYVGVFALGVLFALVMVVPALWFISPMLILCLVIVDFFLMLTSSAYGISAAVRLLKKGSISKKAALLYILLHLIFVMDVLSAVSLYRKSR